MIDRDTLRAKTREVYDRLVKAWGYREWRPRRDAMTELISTMLSHRTTSRQEWAAMERLWSRYRSWPAISAAPVEEVEALIHGVSFAEVKAPRIQAALRQIGERTGGTYDLSFLGDLTVEAGLAWLTSLPGVGIKTASLVLLFNFHKPALPVDTHVHRVAGRIGLIGPKTTAERAHQELPTLLPPDPDVYYNFHVALLTHGRRICTWANPKCEQCVVNDLCDYYLVGRCRDEAS